MKWSLGELSFDALTLERAAQKVILAAKKRNCTLVVTPNATMLHRASCDRELFALLQGAELVLPDGAGVILASRYLKTPYKPEKVAGVSLGERVLALAAERGLSVYFFGGKAGVAARAAKRMKARYPLLIVAGVRSGFDFDSVRLSSEIGAAAPDIVFCCLGSPLQERVGRMLADLLSCPVLCLGGSLDVYAGDKRRAPRLFQALSLEWLWRMLAEPRRFRGISSLFGFSVDVVRLKNEKKSCIRARKGL